MARGDEEPALASVGGASLIDGAATATNPAEAVERVLAVLDLKPGDDEDTFIGSSYRPPWGRIFGGQVLAQSLLAAIRTAPPDRPPHSLHAYFLRPGNPDLPITFQVERLRDGRSFSARRTQAVQAGKPILSMISSFQFPAEGMDHADPMPDVPGPDEVPTLDEVYGHLELPGVRQILRSRAVDMRHVEGPLFLKPGPEKVARQAVWMRAAAPLPDDQNLHTAMLAFSSDYSLLESVLRRHGMAWNSGIKMASLDHAMWFHRPSRLDQWLLYVQRSPSASGGRGLGVGEFFTQDGVLVATVAQEGMLRPPRD
jgi:acyl-CoA thioesterase-2